MWQKKHHHKKHHNRAQHNKQHGRQHNQNHHQHGPHLPNKLLRELDPSSEAAQSNRRNAKRPAPTKPSSGGGSKRSRFMELVEQDAIRGKDHRAAIAGEDALQASLAKKLGIKHTPPTPPNAKTPNAKRTQGASPVKANNAAGVLRGEKMSKKHKGAVQQKKHGMVSSDDEYDDEDGDAGMRMVMGDTDDDEDEGASSEGDMGGSDFDWQSDLEEEGGFDVEEGGAEDGVGDEEDEENGHQQLDTSEEEEDVEEEEEEAGDYEEEEEEEDVEEEEETHDGHQDTTQNTTTTPATRYIPPALRAATKSTNDTDQVHYETARRVRGLLNRLAESNLHTIVPQLEQLYEAGPRHVVVEEIIDQLLQAVAEGPRATDAFAAVTACCVAALAGRVHSQALAARFMQRLACRLQEAREHGTTTSTTNLVNVFAHIYACGLIGSELLYSLLNTLNTRFAEADVALIASIVRSCGMRMRADDPAAMKAFVVSVHARAAEAAAVGGGGGGGGSHGGTNGAGGTVGEGGGQEGKKGGGLSARTEAMLGLVLDVKNNRGAGKRGGGKGGGGKGAPGKGGNGGSIAAVLTPATARWVAGCGVAEVQLRNLSWGLLLERHTKGHWWEGHLSTPTTPTPTTTTTLASGVGVGGTPPIPTMTGDTGDAASDARLQALAAQLRLNTDARRAVFYAVMGSSDVVDASEKLLRLELKGEQQREVVRVTVTCCLHERAYNPYYAHLLMRLIKVSKAHAVTLRYCLWDHCRALEGGGDSEGGPVVAARRAVNLSRLMASMIAGVGLPLLVLKVVDWAAPMQELQLLTWQTFWKHLCMQADAATLTDIAARAIATKGAGDVCRALASFVQGMVVPWLRGPVAGSAETVSRALLMAKLLRKGASVSFM